MYPSDLNRVADDLVLWLKEKVITAVNTLLHIFVTRAQQVDTSVDYHPSAVLMPTKVVPINPAFNTIISQQFRVPRRWSP